MSGRDTSIIFVVLSTVSYLLFADAFRAAISAYTTTDKVVLLGIVVVILAVLLKFEGGSE